VIRVNRISLTPSGKFAPVVIESIGLVFLLIRTAEWQPWTYINQVYENFYSDASPVSS
jgi:hypothetical protein